MNRQTFLTKSVVALLLATVAIMLTSTALAQSRGRGPGFGNRTANGPAASVPLTEAEANSLKYMREEEKLARDVYRVLFEQWNAVIFDNIAASEQNHFDAIGRLLSKHGVEDPAYGRSAGIFLNDELQALYNELVANGKLSLDEALAVGVTIEKTDIADLEKALGETERFDIKRVYANLLNGSYSHLEAFETGCDLLAVTD